MYSSWELLSPPFTPHGNSCHPLSLLWQTDNAVIEALLLLILLARLLHAPPYRFLHSTSFMPHSATPTNTFFSPKDLPRVQFLLALQIHARLTSHNVYLFYRPHTTSISCSMDLPRLLFLVKWSSHDYDFLFLVPPRSFFFHFSDVRFQNNSRNYDLRLQVCTISAFLHRPQLSLQNTIPRYMELPRIQILYILREDSKLMEPNLISYQHTSPRSVFFRSYTFKPRSLPLSATFHLFSIFLSFLTLWLILHCHSF